MLYSYANGNEALYLLFNVAPSEMTKEELQQAVGFADGLRRELNCTSVP